MKNGQQQGDLRKNEKKIKFLNKNNKKTQGARTLFLKKVKKSSKIT